MLKTDELKSSPIPAEEGSTEDIGETLRRELAQPEFSEGYAESFHDAYIATQIKVLRERSEWTQARLAAEIGTTQTVISRIENVNYSAWNISTLKRLARAFRVRLRVSFETYGSLIDEVERFSREALDRLPREKDPILVYGRPARRKEVGRVLFDRTLLTPGLEQAARVERRVEQGSIQRAALVPIDIGGLQAQQRAQQPGAALLRAVEL